MKEIKRAKTKTHKMTTRKKQSREATKKRRRRKTVPKNSESKGASRSRRICRQCLLCGAEVDQKFGTGERSWCPYCHQPDYIYEKIGEFPDPVMYGHWLLEQEEVERKANAIGNVPPSTFLPARDLWRDLDKRSGKIYSGVYTCIKCRSEFTLHAATSSACHKCGSLSLQGAWGWAWKNQNGRDG